MIWKRHLHTRQLRVFESKRDVFLAFFFFPSVPMPDSMRIGRTNLNSISPKLCKTNLEVNLQHKFLKPSKCRHWLRRFTHSDHKLIRKINPRLIEVMPPQKRLLSHCLTRVERGWSPHQSVTELSFPRLGGACWGSAGYYGLTDQQSSQLILVIQLHIREIIFLLLNRELTIFAIPGIDCC